MRPRTRSQWDEHYSNLNNNKKKSNISTTASSSGGVSRRSNRLRNSLNSEPINNIDQDCIFICEESTTSFDRDKKCSTTSGVDLEEPISNMDQDFIIISEKNSSEDNYVSNSEKRSSGRRTRNSASFDRDFRGKNIVNVSDSDNVSHSDDDDDVIEYLGEKLFGNGSTSKFSTEKSRSESDSKAGNQDDGIYYFITKRDNGGNNSLDRSKDVDLGNNSSSDDSDKSLGDSSLSEDESTSDDEESLDDDYKVDESTDSELSDDSHYGVDENENRTEGEEENSLSTIDSKREKDDESDEGDNRGSRCSRRISKEGREKDVIFIDAVEKSPIKKSISQNKENDDVIVEGCRAITRSKTNANDRKNEAAVISNESENERFSPSIGNGVGSSTEKLNKLKKRKVSIFEDSDTANENADISTTSVNNLPSYSCGVGENDDVIVEGCHAITRSRSRSNKTSANNPGNEDLGISIDNIEEEMRCPGIDESNKSGLKKTRASIFEDSDKANDKDSESPNNEVSGKKKNRAERNIELVKILVESINLFKGQNRPIEESGFIPRERLPTRFRFEDEVEPTVEKSEWEKEMDSLFHDLELGLRGLDTEHDSSEMENDDVEDIDTSLAACCRRGEHQPILDEQIGIVCKYCAALILHIKYVLPPFVSTTYTRSPTLPFFFLRRLSLRLSWSSSSRFHQQPCRQRWRHHHVPAPKRGIRVHMEEHSWLHRPRQAAEAATHRQQRQRLHHLARAWHRQNETDDSVSRLVSEALPQLPPRHHRPQRDAPRLGIGIRQVESRHSLPQHEQGGHGTSSVAEAVSVDARRQHTRNQLPTVRKTRRRKSRRRRKQKRENEGDSSSIHRPISARRRPHTPKQAEPNMEGTHESLDEKMHYFIRKKTSVVDRKKWKAMLDPFVHIHKGTILEESLPGLMNTLVFLHPTELQKNLLEASAKERKIFARIRLVSMVSVHPSLFPEKRRSVAQKNILEDIESDFEAGVKTKFVVKLIHLAEALNERVLIFSQYIDPLVFIKNTIKSRFSWNEGREILYMDGQLDERQRQDSISSFNDERSGAKVLLASERACSEGINLVGASRVVLLDTVWNPSVEKQAISRAYRIGQKKVVYVYRLFTSGTEVRQYSQQAYKERISEMIFADLDDDDVDGREMKKKKEMVHEDKVLDAMIGIEGFGDMFEKIIHQPKESDLIQLFGLVDCN
ncbi:hypothetical protein MIMGU_mgv1a026898mg [Erythranthe guttata]|uniref:Helicase C-terminal domain-containing protein n=1 Tax=Erythranthe guttata TaxID=4155 RepID=A0A022RE21_ERYGU|nr:hypothetical protein MIMGU_mgv1a026898mg [Erythranthe guttata]